MVEWKISPTAPDVQIETKWETEHPQEKETLYMVVVIVTQFWNYGPVLTPVPLPPLLVSPRSEVTLTTQWSSLHHSYETLWREHNLTKFKWWLINYSLWCCWKTRQYRHRKPSLRWAFLVLCWCIGDSFIIKYKQQFTITQCGLLRH